MLSPALWSGSSSCGEESIRRRPALCATRSAGLHRRSPSDHAAARATVSVTRRTLRAPRETCGASPGTTNPPHRTVCYRAKNWRLDEETSHYALKQPVPRVPCRAASVPCAAEGEVGTLNHRLRYRKGRSRGNASGASARLGSPCSPGGQSRRLCKELRSDRPSRSADQHASVSNFGDNEVRGYFSHFQPRTYLSAGSLCGGIRP